jgi:hypothetical protein
MQEIEKRTLELMLAKLRLQKARREHTEPDYIFGFDDVERIFEEIINDSF